MFQPPVGLSSQDSESDMDYIASQSERIMQRMHQLRTPVRFQIFFVHLFFFLQ